MRATSVAVERRMKGRWTYIQRPFSLFRCSRHADSGKLRIESPVGPRR